MINGTCHRLGIKPTDRLLVVSIEAQTLRFYRGASLVKTYVISTSKRPPSNVKNSFGTPQGLHQIAERIGAGQPPGMVFKARVPTGRHYSEFAQSDLKTDDSITSRIFWLRGMEPGVNLGGDVDTYERYVYIHGTRHEDKLGTPASAGCVRMGNLDIVELHEEVRNGDLVWIGP